MRTRKVTVTVVSYPEDYNRSLSLRRIMEMKEFLEYRDTFITSKSSRQILQEYIDKVDVYASFVDEIRWYRIYVRDSDISISQIHKV